MSKMFDYITKGGDKVAELEASLEHMGGHLEIELAENAKLRAAIKRWANAYDGIDHQELGDAEQALRSHIEQQGENGS